MSSNSTPPTEAETQLRNCCRLGLALATGSTFVAVGCLLRSGTTVSLLLGLLGSMASLVAFAVASRGARGAGPLGPGDPSEKEIVQLKDSFLSTISHELRTPLTNICAYTEILLHLVPGDEAEWPEFLRIVQTEGQRLTKLVDSVMDYVRLESGEIEVVVEQVEVDAVARKAVEMFASRARARHIDVRLEAEPGLPRIWSDGARLLQVLQHLLDNALKFTPAGGVVAVHVAAGREGLVVTIDDSGPGICPEMRERAFEKFTQLRDHLTAKPEGTGLGLATVRLLLARLGGAVNCEDSPLGGARFRFRVPFGAPDLESVPPALPAPARETAQVG